VSHNGEQELLSYYALFDSVDRKQIEQVWKRA